MESKTLIQWAKDTAKQFGDKNHIFGHDPVGRIWIESHKYATDYGFTGSLTRWQWFVHEHGFNNEPNWPGIIQLAKFAKRELSGQPISRGSIVRQGFRRDVLVRTLTSARTLRYDGYLDEWETFVRFRG